jgi:branched-chain amino acid transport system substrate-binding protein
MKKIWIVIIIIVVIALLVSYIETKRGKMSGEIKIGVILPLTGDGAVYGERFKKGIDLAFNEIKSQNLIRQKVKLIYEDDKLDPSVGVSVFQKLVTVDKVPCVIGPISSGIVLAIAPLANKYKVVVLSPYASNYKITDAGPYIFRNYPSDAVQGVVCADLAIKMGFKKAAILNINSDYGVGLKIIFQKEFTKRGGQIVYNESFNTGETDFRTYLTKIKNSGADFVFLPGNEKEIELILMQAKELNLNLPIISTDSFLPEPIIKKVGNAAEGVIFTTFYEYKGKEYEVFYKKFKERYKEPPTLLEGLGYDAMWVMVEAIKSVIDSGEKVTGPNIKEALHKIKFKGVTGEISFDKNGDLVGQEKRFIARKIQNLKVVNLEVGK